MGENLKSFVGNEGLHFEFQITTKAVMCLKPGGSSKEGILKGWEESEKGFEERTSMSYSPRHPFSNRTLLIEDFYVGDKLPPSLPRREYAHRRNHGRNPIPLSCGKIRKGKIKIGIAFLTIITTSSVRPLKFLSTTS